MRDLISKLDAILLESTTLQDLKQHPAADDPEIQRAIADKEKQQKADKDAVAKYNEEFERAKNNLEKSYFCIYNF